VSIAARALPNTQDERQPLSVAVLVPCYNEELTIVDVVNQFRAALPHAKIYVYDNNSSDTTYKLAQSLGVEVRKEARQGKGHVVRRMFADIDADIYILVDGDATYDASSAPLLIDHLVTNRLDFVNAARVPSSKAAYRPAHELGNRLLTGAVRAVFGRDFSDMLSGYKVFSRRYVASFPAMSRGFEIETEFTIHALELQMPCGELSTVYKERPEGSTSKLRTVRDGFRISTFILKLLKDERPLLFFGGLGVLAIIVAAVLGVSVLAEFFETGLVPRLPTAILSAALINFGSLLIVTGFILDLITKARQEVKRLAYISVRPPA